MARALAGSGSVTTRGAAGRQQAVDEGADEGRAMAVADHVGLADELVDAARAERLRRRSRCVQARQVVALQIGERPPVGRDDELHPCAGSLEIAADQLELLVGIAPPLGDMRRRQPALASAAGRAAVMGRNSYMHVTHRLRPSSVSTVTLRLV